MNILGISCFYHDGAACLVKDGEIVAAAQEERFTRVKHDPRFPKNAARFCLRKGGLTIGDVDYVAFYDKPFLTFERLLKSFLASAPGGVRSFLAAMPSWLSRNLHVPKVLERELSYTKTVLYTEHHEAHAASAFYPSPFEEAAVFTVDGVGEWATASYGKGEGKNLTLMAEMRFPDSLGLLYSAFTYFTGFKVNSGEYKLMGLAPFGRPLYRDLILSEIAHLQPDGSLRLNLEYFDFLGGLKMTSKKFARLFGGPRRKPETPITQREMNLAASIQAITEEAMLAMANFVHEKTKKKNLCMAGGVALNCVANGRILAESPFSKVWIQPAAGDAGGAIGAALAVWHRCLENDRPGPFGQDRQKGSFLGPEYSNEAISGWLSEKGYPFEELTADNRAGRVAGLVAEGKIVGYFDGPMEFGPRALGARSILGDARRAETQRIMNMKIKFRESFRPFAPAVLAEDASQYFEMNGESPYMLFTTKVKKERRTSLVAGTDDLPLTERILRRRSDIPAVTHVDYSARVQTVHKETNPRFHAVLSAFKEQTGCSVMVNTSFNVRG
ncbi:MAG: hypothetical protein JRI97_08105, partial [Deltaproteobacteria bacterium]|nr:hypothetical protein [Deltaproteobacteria bacterium]